MGRNYYAVARGHRTGIFTSWNEVKPLVANFEKARYKGFDTLEEAEKFIADNSGPAPVTGSKKKSRLNPDVYFETEPIDSLLVFTDGSSLNNGREGAVAGAATLWPFHPDFNSSCRLPIESKQTNNRGELWAIVKAFEQAETLDPSRTKKLIIFTDSDLSIKIATLYISNWYLNGWKKADGQEPANLDLVKMLAAYLQVRRAEFYHVYSHTGQQNWLSYYNDLVDQSAKGN